MRNPRTGTLQGTLLPGNIAAVSSLRAVADAEDAVRYRKNTVEPSFTPTPRS